MDDEAEFRAILETVTLPSGEEIDALLAAAAAPDDAPGPRCESCRRLLPPRGKRGFPRRFCNSACRMRALRARLAESAAARSR
jgi:hypothetical protein